PITRTDLLASLTTLPEFEGCQREHRAEQTENVEAHHHLGFRPALFLEVMMERSHQENPPPLAVLDARVLEPVALEHHRNGLGHEDAASDEKHERLMDQHCHDSEHA